MSCPHLKTINIPEGNICMECGIVLFPRPIEPEGDRKVVIRMNVSNIFGGQFQYMTDYQCEEAEKIYLKMADGRIFKGRYRLAINKVVDYIVNLLETE